MLHGISVDSETKESTGFRNLKSPVVASRMQRGHYSGPEMVDPVGQAV